MDPLEIAGAVTIFGTAILTVLGVGAAVWRMLRSKMHAELPEIMAQAWPAGQRIVMREEVERVVEPRVAELRGELRPNGGDSFADRIDARFADGDERMGRLEASHERFDGALTRVENKVDGLVKVSAWDPDEEPADD